MKKRLQALVLATVALGFVLVPARDANAISLAGFLQNRGLGGVITTIGDAFNSAINIANQIDPSGRLGGLLTAKANKVFGILFFDPCAPPPT